MDVDRELQRKLLERLKGVYPAFDAKLDQDSQTQGNLAYLRDHGLIEAKGLFESSQWLILAARINEKGIDLLEADGGLGAELGVVRVRLDPDTIHALIARGVANSSLPPESKAELTKRIGGYVGKKLDFLVTKLLEKALENPDLLMKLPTWL